MSSNREKRWLFLTKNVPPEPNKSASEGFTQIKVARDVDISRHVGNDIIFGLVDFEQLYNLAVDSHLSFLDFKARFAFQYGVALKCQRYWVFDALQKRICPKRRFLTPTEEKETFDWVIDISVWDTCKLKKMGAVLGPIKFTQRTELLDMLMTNDEKSNILYYEIKEIPLPGWECLRTLEVAFRSANKWNQVAVYSVSLPGESTVADLIDEIIDKVGWLPPTADVRLLQIIHGKIFKIFSMADKIEDINDHRFTLRAEEVPIEEKELGPLDRFIHIYHFKKETGGRQMQIETFGEPFLLAIRDGETLGQVKIRIQKKLQVQAEDFSKWRFAYIAKHGHSEPVYLEDESCPWKWFRAARRCGTSKRYLGLEHSSSPDEIDTPRSSEKEIKEEQVRMGNEDLKALILKHDEED